MRSGTIRIRNDRRSIIQNTNEPDERTPDPFARRHRTGSSLSKAERISLGRSSAAELCFPDDNGLSRQHLAIERDGDGWALRDLGSKNGTMLNGAKITERTPLKSGDRITAGHLILVYDGASSRAAKPVVVFDPRDEAEAQHQFGTVITQLEGVIKATMAAWRMPQTLAASHVSALIRAGNELAGHRPLPELFRFILDLAIQAVKADRGVLMTLEDGELVVQANQGEGFRISDRRARPRARTAASPCWCATRPSTTRSASAAASSNRISAP